jgi:regulator of protease activity HflC (stomatin/prohibitin superfamily)
VNDLRSDFASEMLRTLQSKVSSFGVEITNVKITNVELPRELQQRLEKTMAFSTRLGETEKTHRFSLQQEKNDHMQQVI